VASKPVLSKKSAKPAAKPVKKPAAKPAAAKTAAVKKSAKPPAKPLKSHKPIKLKLPLKQAKPEPKGKAGKAAKPEPELKGKKAKPDAKGAKPVPVPQVVKPQAKIAPKKPGESETPGDADSPLLDMSDVGVRKMIARAKQRGYVTYDELNKVLPSDKTSSEQIEDTMAMLNEMGINVIESEEAEEAESEEEEEEVEGGELVEMTQSKALATQKSEPADRTDDPVRMYLREMGSVELLSREGEIAIAKRIEAGREAMIAGLCESPLTFQAIIIWRDELNEGKVLLRDIIDLEATYAGPDGKNTPKIDMTAPGAQEALAAQVAQRAPATAPINPPAGLRRPGDEDGEAPIPEENFEEEDDMENSVSLSAMESELKPKVLETFDRIADAYKKLNKLQVQNVESKLKNETLTPAQERS
jgi:RNA polymerase primary sigma factor